MSVAPKLAMRVTVTSWRGGTIAASSRAVPKETAIAVARDDGFEIFIHP
jgi:hypothetical protein